MSKTESEQNVITKQTRKKSTKKQENDTKKNGQWTRTCPTCSAKLFYTGASGKSHLNYANRNNLICRLCVAQRGWPEETRQKISAALMGNNNAAGNLGKHPTEEARMKMSIAKLGKKRKPFSKEHRKKIRLARIKQISAAKFNGTQVYPSYNPNACQLFEQVNAELEWHGKHAENGGEHYIPELGYWVDYYEPTQNIVIEYDEKWHNRLSRKKRDVIRQREIIEHLGCKFYRIMEGQNWKEILL